MKTKTGMALVCWLWCLSLIGGTAAFAASTPEKDWFIAIAGQQLGKAKITVSNFIGGSFAIEGDGFFYQPVSTFFHITDGQSLSVNYRGFIYGSLTLEDESAASIGTLTITKGKFTKIYDKLVLSGTLKLNSSAPKKITVVGRPMPSSFAVLTGKTIAGGISGKGIFSKGLDIQVKEEDALKFPFFKVTGQGEVNMGGTSTEIDVSGTFIIDPFQDNIKLANAYGTITVDNGPGFLGTGPMQGTLYNTTGFPRLKLYLKTPNYYCTLGGNLDIATSPILSVTPAGTMDFDSVAVGSTAEKKFTITNIGADTLDGEVTLAGDGFDIVSGDSTYLLAAGESTTVTIQFSPSSAIKYTGTATFTGGGGATRSLRGTGTAPSTQ